ncbi:UNVERIFIED_CONTAM: hypothetical protein GTU68_029655 [Idotea baltica]|nr:hypothetical protein [Idotea baltica]
MKSVDRSKPETPPSRSAIKGEQDRPPYLQQLREIFTSVPYLLILLTLGAGVGIFNAVTTLTQQLLCPLGYSDVRSIRLHLELDFVF